MIREPLKKEEEIADSELPPFFRELAERFLSRQSNVFLLSGSVGDRFDALGISCARSASTDSNRYIYLDDYLTRRMESRGRFVITYNIARGIDFSSNEQYNALREFYAQYDAVDKLTDRREIEKRATKFDRSIVESQVYSFLTIRFLEELCLLSRKYRGGPVTSGLTVIIKHVETLLPDAPLAQMADIDRQKLTLLTEWFSNPEFVASNEQVILISSTNAAVHGDIRRLPHVAALNVPLPDAAQRSAFITWMANQAGLTALTPGLPELTAGMTLLTLQNLLLKARHRGGAVDAKDVLEELNRLLVSELGDKIEVMKPAHTMGDVLGASALKKELERLKALLATRDPKVAPVGILVPGPNGVGKTYIFEAWAAELDRLVIVLKNLRSMYFGQTDQIFEKLRNVLEALGNVVVFIDEADTVFGRPGANTHETESRLFGNLITMMGNPKNRGRILWILLTARPDNLAPDLKRSGRAGLHLSVFDPEGQDRRDYVDSIFRRAGFDPSLLTPEHRSEIDRRTSDLSPADFNEVLVELRAEKALNGELTFDRILSSLQNIMPGQIAAQRRVQTLNAYLECSRRSLIPDSLLDLDRVAAENELEELRRRLVR